MNRMFKGRRQIWYLIWILSLTVMCGCSHEKKPDGNHEKTNAKENVEKRVENTAPDQPESKPVDEKPMIAIDPGHQSEQIDMGALEENGPGSTVMKRKATQGTRGIYSGKTEYQLNLEISLRLKTELERRGFQVVLTREDNNTAISNKERAVLSNQADVAIRIHANGSETQTAQGALCLIMSPENPYVGELYEQSYRLADEILTSYCQKTGFQNRGITPNDTMTGLNWSEIPVTILEMGFMTNPQDDQKMADAKFQESMVQGIADGIENYFTKYPKT